MLGWRSKQRPQLGVPDTVLALPPPPCPPGNTVDINDPLFWEKHRALFGIKEKPKEVLGKRVRKRVDYRERGGAQYVDVEPDFEPVSDQDDTDTDSDASVSDAAGLLDNGSGTTKRRKAPMHMAMKPARVWNAAASRGFMKAMNRLGLGRWHRMHDELYSGRQRMVRQPHELRQMGYTVVALCALAWLDHLADDGDTGSHAPAPGDLVTAPVPSLRARSAVHVPGRTPRRRQLLGYPDSLFDRAIGALHERVRVACCPASQLALWYFQPETRPRLWSSLTGESVVQRLASGTPVSVPDPLKIPSIPVVAAGAGAGAGDSAAQAGVESVIASHPVAPTVRQHKVLRSDGEWNVDVVCTYPAMLFMVAEQWPTNPVQNRFEVLPHASVMARMRQSSRGLPRACKFLAVRSCPRGTPVCETRAVLLALC